MPQSPRLSLPLIAAGQSQKDVTHNEALLALDRMVALAVVSRSLAAPPADPSLGEIHIVSAAGASAWGHPAGHIVQWQGSGWLSEAARDGQVALVTDEAQMLVFRGDWQALWPVAGLVIGGREVLAANPVTVSAPIGGSTIDAQVRVTVAALISALQQQGILST